MLLLCLAWEGVWVWFVQRPQRSKMDTLRAQNTLHKGGGVSYSWQCLSNVSYRVLRLKLCVAHLGICVK